MSDHELTGKSVYQPSNPDIRRVETYISGPLQITAFVPVGSDEGREARFTIFRGQTSIAGMQVNDRGQTRQEQIGVTFNIEAATIKEAAEMFKPLEKKAQEEMVAKLNSKIVVAGGAPPPPRLAGDNGKGLNRRPRDRNRHRGF